MTKVTVERFECDAPGCDDVAEIPLPGGSPLMVGPSLDPQLPEGWIEFQVMGTAVDGSPRMVHASKPSCMVALAEGQIAASEKADEERKAQEETRRKAAEEAIAGSGGDDSSERPPEEVA